MQTRGLSAVVTTLLIILLSIIAIGIIWVVVKNVLSEGAEGISLQKFTLDLGIKYAYIDGTDIKVGIRRSSGEGDLVGIKFIFVNSTGSVPIDRTSTLGVLQESVFTFSASEIFGISSGDDVSIAPIYLSSSGKEQTGEITDTEQIQDEAPVFIIEDEESETGESGTGTCGDGIIQTPNSNALDEQCDGSNLYGQTCISLGYEGGALFCTSGCQFDVSSCTVSVPSSCNGTWEGGLEDSGVECDAGYKCSLTCVCPVGFTPDNAGGCLLDSPLNTGIIYSVWPSGAVKYFDSEDFPVDVSDYPSYYVNFTSSSENGCFRITWAEYLELNGRSYIRTEFVTSVIPGEQYFIWEAENCGN